MTAYKLYVWHKNFATNYHDGLAVAAARSVEEAREVICDTDGDRPADVGDDHIIEDLKRDPDEILDLPAGRWIFGSA